MHVIRIWEQRYNAVLPRRTDSNRRLYRSSDIERLILLRDAIKAGYKIGQIAEWTDESLRNATREVTMDAPEAGEKTAKSFLTECREAIERFDAVSLADLFQKMESQMGALGTLQKVIAPLSQSLGEWWRLGEITSAQEHFATAEIRAHLSQAAKPFGDLAHAPGLVVTTPAGQIHELGALLVAAVATQLGWRVTYLGASLPAAEIASAVKSCGAKALALSLVFPCDDPALPGELLRLRKLLPTPFPILMGGRAVSDYRKTIRTMGAVLITTLPKLGKTLDQLRTRRVGV